MRSIIACFTFILAAAVLGVEGRYLQNRVSSTLLTSDGVDDYDVGVQTQKDSHLFLKGNTGKTEPYDDKCEQMYGFLPCSTTMFGHLFLILVYEFLLFHGESYLAAGGEQIFKILGPGVLGASAFDLLGALPESLILLVTGLSSKSKESAQEYASTGVGLLAGCSILLVTVVWGTCVITGKEKFEIDSTLSTSSSSTKKESLAGFGITMDEETRGMARIMVLSVIPLIIMQIPTVFQFSSALCSVTLMVALFVTAIFVVVYFIYQHVEEQTLQKILTEDGTPNMAAISGLYNEIRQHDEDRDLLVSEVKELLLKNKLTATSISEEQVKDMLKVFDLNGDQIITKEEFVNGLTKWIEQTKYALVKQYMPRESLQNIYQSFLKPWIEHVRKECGMKRHLISEILRHSQSNMVVGRLLNDDGTVDNSAIRRLFEETDIDGDNCVSQSELKKLFTNIKFDEAVDVEEAAKRIIQELDLNRDNVISVDEFVNGITKLVNSFSRHDQESEPLLHEETHQTWECVEKALEEKQQLKGTYAWLIAIINVVLGITILSILAEPLIASVQKFSADAGIPSFFASFILVPLATNFRESTAAIKEASHKKRNNTSQTIYEIYGAVFMNNILGFLAIATLIYVREITWEFSAELLVVAIVCAIMGLYGSFRPTIPLRTSFGAYLLYLLSLVLVYVLNDVLHYV